MNKGIQTNYDVRIYDLEKLQVYHSEGIDSDATYTYYYLTDKHFLTALVWESTDGQIFLEESVLITGIEEVYDLTLSDAYYLICSYLCEHSLPYDRYTQFFYERIYKTFSEAIQIWHN